MTDSGCLLEGNWDKNRLTGDFFMVRPNGNCFVGSQTTGELRGFIYPYSRIANIQKICSKKGEAPARLPIDEKMLEAGRHVLGSGFQQRFEKVFATGQVFYTPYPSSEVTSAGQRGKLPSESSQLQPAE